MSTKEEKAGEKRLPVALFAIWDDGWWLSKGKGIGLSVYSRNRFC
jgi:hypothetical protein